MNCIYCELPATPSEFDIAKFKSGDDWQIKLYKSSKAPRRRKLLSSEQIKEININKDDPSETRNYARVIPMGCMFIDFDDTSEAEQMLDIILTAKLKCLILETSKGYHFLFRTPEFYKVEMTKATNWFGFKFDTKATTDRHEAVQILRVCGMTRNEYFSWNYGEVITPEDIEKLEISSLDILPYWLWGKLKDSDLHKKGRPGESEYTLINNPLTQLIYMEEGGRHDHIVSRCSYFALSNGFLLNEFKDYLTCVNKLYLSKHGSSMSDSDLFGDLDTRWEDYKSELLSSGGWIFSQEDRKWRKAERKIEKIDERRAAEYLFNEFDCYGQNRSTDTGLFTGLSYRYKDGDYEYKHDVSVLRQKLKAYSDQNFKDQYFREVEAQLMQLCAENHKTIKRSHEYVISKNKVMSCISPEVFDFSWLGNKSPTDVVLPWNWYPEEWVEEHKWDLGGLISRFIKELSRDVSGNPHPEVERWLYVIAGASMIPANDLQKIVILSGGGANGKSIFTSLIRFCLGDNMYNTSKIFDSSPQDTFWGKDFDRGILCVVDDLPRLYNRDAFSYIKGAITGSDTIEINEKYKPKKTLSILPQIIACTNFDFELYDKSEGMKRRVKILPTEYEIPTALRDPLLQFKLVLNTTDNSEISNYRLKHGTGSSDAGNLIIRMRTREMGVLQSLESGSLAWFANKSRYEYFKAAEQNFIIGDSDGMVNYIEGAFAGGHDAEAKDFLEWYVTERGEDIWLKDLYLEYQSWHNEAATGEAMMRERIFSVKIGKAMKYINEQKKYLLVFKKVKNDKGITLNKLIINK